MAKTSLLKRWKRAGYTRADVQGMYHAAQIMNAKLGPQMTRVLKQYGLTDLTGWAKTKMVGGASEEEIVLELYDQPAFKKRFPAISARDKAGLSPISVDDYINYERTVSELGNAIGLKLTKAEVDNLLANDVSASEAEQRFNLVATAVHTSSPETRMSLRRLHGINDDQIARYWMDPKKNLAELQNQYRMGEIAGAALRTGFGEVTKAEAGRLLETGFDQDSALEAWSSLHQMRELFTPINRRESAISRDEQIAFLTGDVDTARDIDKRVRERVAMFGGRGGGFVPGGEGFTTGTST